MNSTADSIFTHVKLDKADFARGRTLQKSRLAATPLAGNRQLIEHLEKNPRRVSTLGTMDQLKSLLARSLALANPANAACAKAFFEGAMNAIETADHKKQMTEMVAAAVGNGAESYEAKVALSRLIANNVGMLIRCTGDWIQWYESKSLQPDEVPYLRNFVPQVGDVRVGTQDGTMAVKHVQPDLEDDSLVPLFTLISDVYVATLFDPYKGFISDAALGTLDISMDLMEKIDGLLQLPFSVGTPNSAFVSSFTVDNTPAAHYHASARIFTSNFPAGNIIAPSSNGASTKPRYDVLRAIDEYLGRFGSAIDGLGVTQVRVAAGVAHQFGDEFSVSTPVNAYSDQVFKNRSRMVVNGRTMEIVPDITIDPADPHVYVKGPSPAGLYFDKPAGAKVSRTENEVRNEVTTFERALIGYAIPNTFVPRVLAVRYKS